MDKRYNRMIIIGALLVMLVVSFIVAKNRGNNWFTSKAMITYQIDRGDNVLGLGSQGETAFINLEDITSVELREELDLGDAVSDVGTNAVNVGTYKNSEFGEYRIFIYNTVAEFIIVRCGDEVTVFNCDTVKETNSTYDDLMSATGLQ